MPRKHLFNSPGQLILLTAGEDTFAFDHRARDRSEYFHVSASAERSGVEAVRLPYEAGNFGVVILRVVSEIQASCMPTYLWLSQRKNHSAISPDRAKAKTTKKLSYRPHSALGSSG